VVQVVRLAAEERAPRAVTVGPATRTVHVEVPVDEGPPSWDAIVRTSEGAEVWRAEGLVPAHDGARLVVAVPARLLASADYVLAIEGETLRGESPSAHPREYRLHVTHSDR
jgi:hypothetical protein